MTGTRGVSGRVRSGAVVRACVLVLAIAALTFHARHYWPFISDDGLISLRYAKRLLQTHSLTWNTGERVEGYSNLLWVLCSAAIGWTGLDLVTAVRILGFAATILTFAAVMFVCRPIDDRHHAVALSSLSFLAVAGPVAIWTIGGLEQPMVAALLAWGILLLGSRVEHRRSPAAMVLPGLVFGLLCLARVDGFLFTIAAAVAMLLSGRARSASLISVLWFLAVPALLTASQFAFRRAYYGVWVPNTALVKFTPSLKHAIDGLDYLRGGAMGILPLILLGGASLILCYRKQFMRATMLLLCTIIVLWSAYLVAIGGDIFPGWRHFVPLLVALVMMVSIGMEWLATNARTPTFAAAMVACAMCLIAFGVAQYRDSENRRALLERWEFDGQEIGIVLKKSFWTEQPLLAVDSAGCLPYWSDLPALDLLGLNDAYLPKHPPGDFGSGFIGHELGNGQYVLDRRPDLIVFSLPIGRLDAVSRSGREMQANPRFSRDYSVVRVESEGPRRLTANVWVRTYSERIGIRENAAQVVIPGFLLNGNSATRAHLGAAGKLAVTASDQVPARTMPMQLPPGRWRVDVAGSETTYDLRIYEDTEAQSDAAEPVFVGPTPATLVVPSGRRNRVVLEFTGHAQLSHEITQVQLTRLSDS